MIMASFNGLDLILGLAMDLMVGDPEGLPHPIRLIGKIISKGERLARQLDFSPFIQGVILTCCVVLISFSAPALIVGIATNISYSLGLIISGLLIYYSLALKCLAKEAILVAKALETGDLIKARKQVSRIVGRDTSSLSEQGVAAAAIETVAENFVDGFFAPFFYAAIGGAPLAMGYKAVNTLDSMIGYRNDRYKEFGKAAARLDDIANYLPARLALFIISLSCAFVKRGAFLHLLKMGFQEGKNHKSPNAGLPEAVFAYCLGVKLSGPISYEGKNYEKPYMNPNGKPPVAKDIYKAVRLLYLSSGIGVILVGLALKIWAF